MSGFADRFSDSQRAALAALGYTVLERITPCGSGVSRDQPIPEHATLPQPESRLTPLPQESGAASRGGEPGATRPSAVLIEGMDGSGLARGLLAAVLAAAGESRVSHGGERLRVVLDGDGDAWQLSLHQLRRSPRHKAALWRALRTLRHAPP